MRIKSLHIAALALLINCGSPFFPETGIPLTEETTRATPEGAIRQLAKSYENRRIDLFEELIFSDEKFRFYIELDPAIYQEFNHIVTTRTEMVAINSDFIPDGNYVYLTASEEKQIHAQLFQQANEITFVKLIEVLSVEYIHASQEYGSLYDSTDSLIAIVRTDNAIIRIAADVIKSEYAEDSYSFPVGKQIFYLKKDAAGLWRILYWFELDML